MIKWNKGDKFPKTPGFYIVIAKHWSGGKVNPEKFCELEDEFFILWWNNKTAHNKWPWKVFYQVTYWFPLETLPPSVIFNMKHGWRYKSQIGESIYKKKKVIRI